MTIFILKKPKNSEKKMGKTGIRPDRLQLEWISAAEGLRFAQVMKDMDTLRMICRVTQQKKLPNH